MTTWPFDAYPQDGLVALGPHVTGFYGDGLPLANVVNRKGSPVYAVLLGFVIAWFQFTVNCITPKLSAYQVYTITIWFFGWIFLSIAAIVFPRKRKDIYEKSPAIVHQSIFGVPWM